MKAKGSELEFISQIERNGLSVRMVNRQLTEHMDNDVFLLYTLSITEKTFIASGFNTFVVRLIEK